MAEFRNFDSIDTDGFITQMETETSRPFVVYKSIDHYLRDRENTANPSWHEIILPNKPRKFFLDIDWKQPFTTANSEYFEGELVKIRLLIIKTFKEMYKIKLLNADIALLRSDGYSDKNYKYSANLVVMKYAIPDQSTFSDIGSKILEEYDGSDGFIDPQQIKSSGKFANRLINCTKYGEKRFKKFIRRSNQTDYTEKELILTNVIDLDEVPSSAARHNNRSNVIVDANIQEILEEYKHFWHPNFEYEGRTNNFLSFRRLQSSHCDCCDAVHDRVGIYFVLTGTKVIIKCHRDKDHKALFVGDMISGLDLSDDYQKETHLGECNPIVSDKIYPPENRLGIEDFDREHMSDHSTNRIRRKEKVYIPKHLDPKQEEPMTQLSHSSICGFNPDKIYKHDTRRVIRMDTGDLLFKDLAPEREIKLEEAFPADSRIKFIRAEMKMGKSKKCVEYLKTIPHDSKIVFISFRRTFSSESGQKYQGFDLYNTIPETIISLKKHPRLIIQLESLNRVEFCEKADVVILDEVESIWGQFDSGNFADLTATVQIFQYLVRNASDIIVMDANLSNRTLKLFEYLIPNHASQSSMYINSFNPSTDINNLITENHDDWIQNFGNAIKAGKNIMIMINSLKAGKKIYRFARTLLNQEDVMFYSSETLESVKSLHFKEVDKYWSKFRVVICTPTISAGVSFEKEHFHMVMGYFSDMSCNVQTCQQMIGRVRDVIDKKVILYFSKHNTKTFSTDQEEIEKILSEKRAELVKDTPSKGIGNLNFEISEEGLLYHKNFSYWLVVYNIIYDNESRNDFPKLYEQILRSKQSPVSKLTRDNKKDYVLKYNSSNKKFDEEFTRAVNETVDITLIEYNEIKEKRQRMMDIPEEDVIKYNKFRMMKSLANNSKELTIKQVDYFYKNHNNLSRLDRTREICELLKTNDWEKSIAILQERDYKYLEKNRLMDLNRVKLHSQRHKYIRELLISYPGFGNSFLPDSDIRKLFTTQLTTRILTKQETEEYTKLLKYVYKMVDYTESMDGSCFAQLCSLISDCYILDVGNTPDGIRIFGSPHISFKYSGEYYIRSKLVTAKTGVAKNIPIIDC